MALLDSPVRPPAAAWQPPPAANGGFASSKTRPPHLRQASLLVRPVLSQRLQRALMRQRLVLLSAAAGFGKTTALAHELARLPADTAVAWVTLDEGDGLQDLIECLLDALRAWMPAWIHDAAAAARRTDARADAMVHGGASCARSHAANTAVNALDACDVPHGVIVIDDLHRVDNGPLFEFLGLLLERLSPRWTLAIATRHDPPLSLARYRAWGEVAEFRQADLAFSSAEVQALARAAGLDASQADSLLARTQGWACGLRLAIDHAGGPGADGDRTAIEFLASEVIDRLDSSLRRFLLLTSPLRDLTPAAAALLSGHPRAARLIEVVDRMGLFANPLPDARDGAESGVQLHPQFREALAQRLQREQPDLWHVQCRLAAAVQPELEPGDGHVAPPPQAQWPMGQQYPSGQDEGQNENVDLNVNDTAYAADTLAGARPSLDRDGARLSGLSPRECEVLARLAAGDSNKLIARALELSPHTVKRHVANILDKVGARSRGQAAAWFLTQH